MIQSGINQLISQAAIFGRLSPGVEERHELHKLKKEQSLLEKQGEAAKLKGKDAKDPDLIRSIGDIKQREMELAKKKFQLDPTEENFQSAVQQQQSYRAFNKYEELMMQKQIEAADKANARALQKGAQQVKQRRDFMDYLSSMETSLGGKVGDLPLQMQKQIAKDYSKSERKKMMDEMDKEKQGK